MQLGARIVELDAAGPTLRQIAAATGVSTFSVRSALGRVLPGGRASAQARMVTSARAACLDQRDGETTAAGGALPVLPDPVPRDGERALAGGAARRARRSGLLPGLRYCGDDVVAALGDRGAEPAAGQGPAGVRAEGRRPRHQPQPSCGTRNLLPCHSQHSPFARSSSPGYSASFPSMAAMIRPVSCLVRR